MSKSKQYLVVLLTLLSLFYVEFSRAELADRYFLMGSGKLYLKNLRNNQEAQVELLDESGLINEAALSVVDDVFGFPTNEKGEHISLRMLFMLSYFADQVAPGSRINIESAYRSPEYNDKIRKGGANAAKTSTHIDGLALDFWIEGVDGKALWEMVRQRDCCGVGHYGGKTIHLDAGRPRFWEAATSGTKRKEPDYNRHLYLATEFDRYTPGEELRLSLSGISTFDFGIATTVKIYTVDEPVRLISQAALIAPPEADCLMIDNRKATRFLYFSVPASLAAGRYKVQLEFCQKPFEKMPDKALSNEIEVVR